jgi:hypothetical protein
VNTSTVASYPDVDAARIQWDSPTEGTGSWDDHYILGLCRDIQRILTREDKSADFKVGYTKIIITFIEETIKAKGR